MQDVSTVLFTFKVVWLPFQITAKDITHFVVNYSIH